MPSGPLPGLLLFQGIRTDEVVKKVLDAAVDVGMEVALHLEPYEGRSAETVRDDLRYIARSYGSHKALHRGCGKQLPVMYVYDSYRIATGEWMRLLHPGGDMSIRGQEHDACVFGLWLDRNDGTRIKDGGFDGMYTYFASDGFTVIRPAETLNPESNFLLSHLGTHQS